MKCSDDALARFCLLNDISSAPAVSLKEFTLFENNFINCDLSSVFSLTLWELCEKSNNTSVAERIYSALRSKKFENDIKRLDDLNINILSKNDKNYPARLKEKLGENIPQFFYTAGDTSFFNKPSCAVTGSRRISKNGMKFAYDIGETIALEKKVLVSGGAPGCDFKSTLSAVQNGGKAVWFLAKPLAHVLTDKQVLNWIANGQICLCSDFNPFGKFSGKQALNRNKFIYANSEIAFVCQCSSKISGTFSGAGYCLKNNLSKLYVYNNGEESVDFLISNGAIPIERID